MHIKIKIIYYPLKKLPHNNKKKNSKAAILFGNFIFSVEVFFLYHGPKLLSFIWNNMQVIKQQIDFLIM